MNLIIIVIFMFELSKQKRMQIMSQISDKRSRLPSNQRRKMVEQEYNQFIKTMNNIKPNILNHSESNNKQQNLRFSHNSEDFIRDSLHFSRSPTVKDIAKPPTDGQLLNLQFYQNEQQKQNLSKIESPNKLNNVNFYKPIQYPNKQIPQQAINELKQEKSINQSQPKVQDEQIKFIINPSVKPSSVNSSQAIFFTSQFKEFINRQNSPPKEVQSQVENKIDQQMNKAQLNQNQQRQVLRLQQHYQITQQEKTQKNMLQNNPSGQSLALSNDSSLKFSLHESAVHQVISQKLKKQLVLDSIGGQNIHQALRSLSLHLLIRENVKDLSQFIKELKLSQLMNKNKKIRALREMIINNQLIFQLRKYEMRVQNHYKDRMQNKLRLGFQEWRNQVLSKKDLVSQYIQKNERQKLQKIFRAFKMLLFDRKITNQISLYYLSKIFFALKNVTQKESKRSNQKAYRFYFKNLKKRMFKFMVDGSRTLVQERQSIEMANQHYYFSLMRSVFDAWKQKSPRQQKYIRLAMTTKNQLKQTYDKRLFQTQTFDFSQIR